MKKVVLRVCAVLFVLVVLVPPAAGDTGEKIPHPQLSAEMLEALKGYLDRHALAPEAYVVSKFENHDVVILGERHYTKHQVEFVQSLIPRLHEAGVYHLATEFARREDQPLIDSLLALPVFDDGLAREITFRQYVHWGFREYVDIFRTVREFNNGLEENTPRFRVIAMNDSPDWSFVVTPEDANKDEIKRKVWRGGGEHLWARAVLDVVDSGNKVLVYSGMHHAFSEFKQPVFDGSGSVINHEDRRMGNHLFKAIGKRVISVCMHYPWDGPPGDSRLTYPADGYIDALMAELGDDYYPVGFDTHGTPFGELSCEGNIYGAGYDNLKLVQFCDGYLFFMPLSRYEGVTPINDFVNEGNIARARSQSPNPKYRNATLAEFYWSAFRTVNLKYNYRQLK